MKTVTFNPATHAVLSIDPTNEMTSKMADALEDPENDRSSWDLAENMFRAMIAAAPEYPADSVKPIAWYLPDVKMVTTSEVERDRWLTAGHIVISLYPI